MIDVSKLTPEVLAAVHAYLDEQERQLKHQARYLASQLAREDLMEFTRLTMPSPEDPDNPALSRYSPARHHFFMADEIMKVEHGDTLRLILSIPPRHGKSELATRRFPAWFTGRNPTRHTMVATYSDTMAEDFGRDVREIMSSPEYSLIFPEAVLQTGSKAADRLRTTAGGQLMFLGRGGAATGRGADLLLIDDPFKNRDEADSPTIREKTWTWFTQVAMSRLMTHAAKVIIIMTRWHEDDLVGRLTDPENPAYNPDEAKKWRVINVPALCEDEENDPFSRKKDEALWPERFNEKFLISVRDLDPRGFSALYQGRPTPIEGDFFKAEWIKTYGPGSMPKIDELRIYATSDHAVSTKQTADSSVFLIGGVDEEDNLYILDCWWRQAPADVAVEGMISFMDRYPILMWWAERGHISKSVGPFLRKRMQEERVYRAIEEVTPVADKATRAGSIQGRMAQGKVYFPRHAPWFNRAKHELLTFPHGAHDDFVDALALFGLGLNKQIRGRRSTIPKTLKAGTFGYMKAQTRRQEQRDRFRKAAGGF